MSFFHVVVLKIIATKNTTLRRAREARIFFPNSANQKSSICCAVFAFAITRLLRLEELSRHQDVLLRVNSPLRAVRSCSVNVEGVYKIIVLANWLVVRLCGGEMNLTH